MPHLYLAIAGLVLAFGIGYKGYVMGADSVRADWYKEKAAYQAKVIGETAAMRAQATKESKTYQEKIARQTAELNKIYKVLGYEISRNHANCTASPELVRLWKQGFGNQD